MHGDKIDRREREKKRENSQRAKSVCERESDRDGQRKHGHRRETERKNAE